MLDLLPVATDATVLDLGAGTGKLTRVLARRYAQRDRGRAARRHARDPRAGRAGGRGAARAARSEIPLDDASVDAVFAAQAFHWFDHDRAIPEIARVLRPGGVLALVWNGPDESRPNPLPADYLDVPATSCGASDRSSTSRRPGAS